MCSCRMTPFPGRRSPRASRQRATTGCAPRCPPALRTRPRCGEWYRAALCTCTASAALSRHETLAADPRAVVHLESGDNVVIVRGTAEDQGPPAQVPGVVAALSAKYTGEGDRQYLPDADPDFDVVYAIRPHSAIMWRLADYEGSQRCWNP